MSRKLLLTGATGVVGLSILELLNKNDQVHILTRSRSFSKLPPGVVNQLSGDICSPDFGLTEKQMLSYVKEARRLKGSTGSVLIQLLEMRLDNIVYRLGIGKTIPASRQIVNHGHIYVNNKKVTIPSFQCSPNDTIEIRNKQNSKKLAERFLEQPSYNTIPHYLEFEKETLKGKVKVELGVAKGKKSYDKREDIAKRDVQET